MTHMTLYSARGIWPIAVALALAACRGNSTPNAFTATTASTHGAFPIATGVHAVSCDTCHGSFSTFTQFTCFNCHAHDQTTTDPLHTTVAGYVYTSSGCYGCHENPGANPAGLVSDASKSVSVNTLVPAYSGTSIVGLSAQVQVLPMSMDHSTSQLPGVDMASCSTCHGGAASGSYFPGLLHSSLANAGLPQPTQCSDCHAESVPSGFVGPLASGRSPASGEMKHDAVAWTNGAPGTTSLVTADCGACHQSPSQPLAAGGGVGGVATWSTNQAGTTPARFHTSLTSASLAQPGSCLDCHANSRPTAMLSSANATMPAKVTFDHTMAPAMADCATCHVSSASPQWTSWAGGRYHLAGSASPTSCLPCHSGERPTTVTGWASTTYKQSPFDYVTNSTGATHGDGQDCALCHGGPGTGAWGGTQNWRGGHFAHAGAALTATTCVACHTTQRPDLQPGTTAAAMASLLGFDHSVNGTGDCLGCHQSTVNIGSYVNYTNPATGKLPGGDWKGGTYYPGSALVGDPTQSHAMAEITLIRSGTTGLVTSTSSSTATLYDQMQHTSAALPPGLSPGGPGASPDTTTCWHCHTNAGGTVTSFASGRYHASLTQFSTTPGGTVAGLPQPTSRCADCHSSMRPAAIVEAGGSDVQPMDHSALFTTAVTLGGASVTGVPQMDCSLCHHSPGQAWTDGVFHANIGSAVPQSCTTCHYPLMADAASADLTSGTSYKMAHRSAQLTFQACATCHTAALSRSTGPPPRSTAWQGGAFHPSLAAQPAACIDCHQVSEPAAGASTASSVAYTLVAGSTASNTAQWMNHGSSLLAGLDCAKCHAADAKASGAAWSKSTAFHANVSTQTGCQSCHGLTNGGGSVVGTNNNMPAGLTSSATATTASQDATTGVAAGTMDQVTHADVNVTGHDCSFCHTQVGPSTTAGVAGREWSLARFHVSFTSANTIVMNSTTGRCSNCHMNVKPGAAFAAQDHSTFTSASGTEDCSSCHSWPGTGTASAPNWLGGGGAPQYIIVGGFNVSQPPATNATTTQAGIASLPHPSTATLACSTCHMNSVGGKGAIGYDHASTLIATNCNSCHEAGSNLVGAPWNGSTTQAAGAGDTRPFTITSLRATRGGDSCTVTTPNHFYPVDCKECHVKPSGTGAVTTGTNYTNAFTFPHTNSAMTNPSTCNMCHNGAGCGT